MNEAVIFHLFDLLNLTILCKVLLDVLLCGFRGEVADVHHLDLMGENKQEILAKVGRTHFFIYYIGIIEMDRFLAESRVKKEP